MVLVPSEKRMNMVKAFNEGENSVFLISLKAGGTGLNLTSADIVIHFDPWWNPAVEEQATDRAHRIGQKNVVEVIKIIAKGTIEEKILSLQEEKKKLISELMGDELSSGEGFAALSEEEIFGLFEMKGQLSIDNQDYNLTAVPVLVIDRANYRIKYGDLFLYIMV